MDIKFDGTHYSINGYINGDGMKPWWDNWQNIHKIGNLDVIVQKLANIYQNLLATGELIA